MEKTASSASKFTNRCHVPVVKLLSSTKCHSTGTQTLDDNICKEYSEQITQLLTEVAITLSHKAKLENYVAEMKQETLEMQCKFDETRFRLEQEIEKLNREKFNKEMEASKLKISYLEDQQAVNNQLNSLKSEIQHLIQENEIMRQDFVSQKNNLEMKININQDDLKKEANKNAHLQLKVNKYKNKLQKLNTFMEQSLQEVQNKQSKEIQTEEKIHIDTCEIKSNMEDLVLTELFFKSSPLPAKVQELFFNQSKGFCKLKDDILK